MPDRAGKHSQKDYNNEIQLQELAANALSNLSQSVFVYGGN